MKQQQTLRGFIFILLILILIATVVRFPYARQVDKITNRDFIKILRDGQAADVNIHQNPQTPTGEVVLTLLDGQAKRLYVSDVKDAQRLLDAHDIVYTTMDVPQENYLVTIILPFTLSIVVVVIIITVMNRSAGGGDTNAGVMSFDKNRARMSRDSRVSFSSVAGLTEEKEELEEAVDFLRSPQKYTNVGARIPEGLLLVDPPRTGKALFAKAVAGEVEVPFFSISGSDFVEMFMGMGTSRVRDLLEEAKRNSPCTVSIDEIDAVAHRGGTDMDGGHDEREQASSQLLVETDGFGVNGDIIVMAATNRVNILDPAVLRPDRFDRKIAVRCPDVKGHEEVLKVHSKGKPLSRDVDLHRVTQTTSDFTGADLESLMSEAVIISTRGNRRLIKQSDINRAFVKAGIGAEKKSKVISEKDKKITACRETGHAILFHVLPDVGPVYTVSTISTEIGAAGYTMPLPGRDEMFNTRDHMMQSTMVDLDGRIAEELMFDDTTTGASQDIEQTTQIARAMMTQYDMSGKVRVIQYGGDENEVFIERDPARTESHGSEVADTIGSEVERIIDRCYQKTKDIIKQYDYVLHTCAVLLIGKEKVNQSGFKMPFTPAQQHSGPVFEAGNSGK